MIVITASVVGARARAAIVRSQRITGLSPGVFAELVAEIGPLWHERHQAVLVSRPRRRAVGAGAKHKLAFVDRLLATLVHLRHGVTLDVLACWFAVDRFTITPAIGELRPLLAARGCTVAPGSRLRTLAEVVDSLRTKDGTAGWQKLIWRLLSDTLSVFRVATDRVTVVQAQRTRRLCR
ncbi:hypothetical protein J2X68_008088 [Streptomyces sp. 3330]|uniref:transposase family protein n=1 Tax=Streptomyces sp. 3330 TaxID=2817755 RepID=UPI0028670066|nr:hypothetical protein [Streptomyces sp. 3330]